MKMLKTTNYINMIYFFSQVLFLSFYCTNSYSNTEIILPRDDSTTNQQILMSQIKQTREFMNNPDISKTKLADSLIETALFHKNDDRFLEAVMLSGRLFYTEGQWDKALEAYALSSFSSKDNSIEQAISMLSIAQIERNNKDFSESEVSYDLLINKLMSQDLSDEKNSGEKTKYGILIGATSEYIDLLEHQKKYKIAAQKGEQLLAWIYENSKQDNFVETNKEFGLDNTRSLVSKCADLYLKAGLKDQSIHVYKKCAELENNKIADKCWFNYMSIHEDPKRTIKNKKNEIFNIYRDMPMSNKKMEVMNQLANYCRLCKDDENRIKILKELANHDYDQESKGSKIYEIHTRSALLKLTHYYLKEGDWRNAEKYLDILESKYRDTSHYKSAQRGDFRGWIKQLKEKDVQ